MPTANDPAARSNDPADEFGRVERTRARRDQMRTDARAILERARAEDRAPTIAELSDVEGLTERIVETTEQLEGETVDQLRRAAASAGMRPNARGAAGDADTPRASREADGLTPASIVLTDDLLNDAVTAINGRRSMRGPLNRAAITVGAGAGPFPTMRPVFLPNRLFDVINIETSRSPSDSALVLELSDPGVGPIGENVIKNEAATATVATSDKQKLAGYVEFTYESRVYIANLEQGLRDTMLAGLVIAENALVVASLAAVPAIAFVDSAATSILVGQATAAMAGAASALLLNPADIATVFGQATTQGGYAVAVDPRERQTAVWGMRAFFSTDVAAGTAFVFDPDAITAFVVQGPEFFSDWTDLRSNRLGLVVDELASVIVTRPAACAQVTLDDGVPLTRASAKK